MSKVSISHWIICYEVEWKWMWIIFLSHFYSQWQSLHMVNGALAALYWHELHFNTSCSFPRVWTFLNHMCPCKLFFFCTTRPHLGSCWRAGSLHKILLLPQWQLCHVLKLCEATNRLHLTLRFSLQPLQPIVTHWGVQLIGPHLNNDACSDLEGAKLIKHINQPTLLAPRPDFDQLWSLFDAECHQCLASSRPRPSRRVHVEAAVPCLPAPSGRPDWRRRSTAWSGLDRPL